MSGSIRKVLGPAKAKLRTYLQEHLQKRTEWTGWKIDSDKPLEPQIDELQQITKEVKSLKSKIQRNYDLLAKKDSEWTHLIEATLSGEARTREIAEYSSANEGTDSLIELLMDADESLAQLGNTLESINEIMKSLRIDDKSSATSATQADQQSLASEEPGTAEQAQSSVPRQIIAPSSTFHRPVIPQPDTPQMDIKLPQFKMSSFNGNPTQWSSFWDVFEAAIHNKPNLSNALKFTYLKGFLTGSAASAIEGIKISNENYEEAIQVLKERFGDVTLIKESLWEKLRLMSYQRGGKLVDTVDAVEQVIRQLKALGEDTNHPYFCQMILQVLPAGTIAELERMKPPDMPWRMESLMQALRDVIKIQERIQRYEKNVTSTSKVQQPQKNPNKWQPEKPQQRYEGSSVKPPTATTDAFGAATKKRQPSSPCAFCASPDLHFNEDCPKYVTPETRKKRADELSLCSLCLRGGHSKSECTTKNRSCIHCNKTDSHNRALCLTLKKSGIKKSQQKSGDTKSAPAMAVNQEKPADPSKPAEESNQLEQKQRATSATQSSVSVQKEEEVMLLLARAYVRNPEDPKRIQEAKIFLDTGSQRSFISQHLTKSLGLSEVPNPISLHKFASVKPTEIESSIVQFEILVRDGTAIPIRANSLPFLTTSIKYHKFSAEDLDHLKAIPSSLLADDTRSEAAIPDVLIGNNAFWKFILPQQMSQLPSGLFLIPSKLGLILGGEQDKSNLQANNVAAAASYVISSETLTNHAVSCQPVYKENADPPLKMLQQPDVSEWWSLEAIGIKDDPTEKDEDKALEQFNSTVRIKDGRFEVGFPWKSKKPDLPLNYGLAYGRLQSQCAKYKADPDILAKCDAIIQDQLVKGVIEEVDPDAPPGAKVHYLPHHAVVTPQRLTTKVRLVFDASSKAKKSVNSLNDCLYPGPVILPDLVGMLFRSRFHSILITADIEKAFLQIQIRAQDKDATRFLWFRDGTIPKLENNLNILRFQRVPFGLNCSPFLLAGTTTYLLQTSDSKAAKKLRRNMYVDNAMLGADRTEEAVELYHESKALFASVKENLREFASNDKELMQNIPAADKAKSDQPSKLLGVKWDTEEDTFTPGGPNKSLLGQIPTKRTILQFVASIFDPLGFISPVVLLCKLLIQVLWQSSISWDDPVPGHLTEYWHSLAQDLLLASTISVPRYIDVCPFNVSTVQLHIFVDASTKAYGVAAYTVIPNVSSHLIFSKSRLVPSRKISLPRMELLALLLGTRASKFLQRESDVHFPQKFLWSDSQCCLHWLQSTKPMSVFVENRLREIKTVTDLTFNYVPTKDNPADFVTRGMIAMKLQHSVLWWEGPTWLKNDRSSWPEWTSECPQDEAVKQQISKEMKSKHSKQMIEMSLAVTKEQSSLYTYTDVIDITRFSSFDKLIRVTIHCFRFLKQKLNLRISLFADIEDPKNPITTKEFQMAQNWWIKKIQEEHFQDSINAIKTKKRHQLTDQLGLHLNMEGLLVCGSRLTNSELPSTAVNPVLLPSNDYFTALLIMKHHNKCMHSGTAHTLSSIREKYWVPKGRATVKRIIKKCYICTKHKAPPFERPPMPPLPKERVQQERPFNTVGLDYLGPLQVKVLNEVKKVWICLFTCTVTRAVHLEVVSDQSAEQFLACLRRFVARRCYPKMIISDNAAQFKATYNLIAKEWNTPFPSDEVLNYCASNNIIWKFIPEFSPWQGGFYERLVQLVKNCLRKAIGKRLLTLQELQTFTAETEACLNSRPLTFIYSDLDSKSILRPIDFLFPYGKIGSPVLREENDEDDPTYNPDENTTDKLKKLWAKSQICLDKFWKYFNTEYLQSLKETQQLKHRDPRCRMSRAPQIGEIVLIKEPYLTRGTWKMGRISHLNESKDGEVRSVKLKLANGKELQRPVSLLHPLELMISKPTEEVVKKQVKESEQTKTLDKKYNLRPRKAVQYKEPESEPESDDDSQD